MEDRTKGSKVDLAAVEAAWQLAGAGLWRPAQDQTPARNYVIVDANGIKVGQLPSGDFTVEARQHEAGK